MWSPWQRLGSQVSPGRGDLSCPLRAMAPSALPALLKRHLLLLNDTKQAQTLAPGHTGHKVGPKGQAAPPACFVPGLPHQEYRPLRALLPRRTWGPQAALPTQGGRGCGLNGPGQPNVRSGPTVGSKTAGMLLGGHGRSGDGGTRGPCSPGPLPWSSHRVLCSLSRASALQPEGVSQGNREAWLKEAFLVEEAERNGASPPGGVRLALSCAATAYVRTCWDAEKGHSSRSRCASSAGCPAGACLAI